MKSTEISRVLEVSIGLYFITKCLSKKLWKPFYSTLQNVEHFEWHKSTRADFIESDIEEFYRLNQLVGRLLEKNVAIYKSQKEFIENASHELQTPLASFQAKLDMLAQQLPFTEELGITMFSSQQIHNRVNITGISNHTRRIQKESIKKNVIMPKNLN